MILGGTLDGGERDPRVDPAIVQILLEHVANWSLALARVQPARAWCCFRPHHPDDMPTIDRIPASTTPGSRPATIGPGS